MIESFQDRNIKRIFKRQRVKQFPLSLQKLAHRKLDLIDGADLIEDLQTPPGNRLEKLSGNRKGQYRIRVNDQWRICFRWRSGQATDVEMIDYH
jgi:proteic killer suppression protein